MAAVLSIQKHTITITSTNASVQANLTGDPATSTANCIPFWSTRVSSVSTTEADAIDEYAVSVDFVAGSPNKVRARTEDFDAGGLPREVVVEVTVVEFNPAEVNVYQGTASMGVNDTSIVLTGGTAPFTSAVVLAKTWMNFGFIGGGTWEQWSYMSTRGRITGTNELTFDVAIVGCTVDIDWYVAEAVSTAWAVDPVDIEVAIGSTSNTATLGTSVGSTAKTFVLGSHLLNGAASGKEIGNNVCDAVLTADNEVTCSRYYDDNTLTWSGFVVELAGSENVYRGSITQTSATASENDSIGATVAEGDSMVVRPGSTGSMGSGVWSGYGEPDVPDAWTAFTFNGTGDVTQITCQHAINGTSSSVLLNWEVIEWDVGGAPPATRRVMVIS